MGFLDFFIETGQQEGQVQEQKNNSVQKNVEMQAPQTPQSSVSSAQVLNPNVFVQASSVQVQENQSVPSQNSVESITEIDEEILALLQSKLIELNRPGPDYIEYNDEYTRGSVYTNDPIALSRGAFANLKKQYPNITKEMIINSIELYKKDLEKERQEGTAQVNLKRQANIEPLENDIAKLENQLKEYQNQLVNLQNLLKDITATINAKQNELQELADKYNRQERIFNNTVDYAIKALDMNKNSISLMQF